VLASAVASYWLIPATGQLFSGPQARFVASAGLGTLLGMRHALEPDHLAAISVLLTGERSIRKAAWLGVYWGIGHTLTLLAAGTLLVVLRADMPAMASDLLACAVVLLLVGFGFRAIYLSAGQASAGPTHYVHGRVTSAPEGRGRRPAAVASAQSTAWR
jgi:high-affinity nickel permease